MKKKIINECVVAGYLYQLCNADGKQPLALKTVQNQQSENYGTEFINGTVAVVVDNEGMNVIEVHYSYVTPTTKQGKPNPTFNALKQLLTEGKTYLEHGTEATKVKLQPSLDLNDFINRDNEIASAKRLEGGFASIVSVLPAENERNTFAADMLISRVTYREADPEKGIMDDYCQVGGAIFNFRGALLPVEFVIKLPAGMDYFQSLEVSSSNLAFTKVWGRINSITNVVTKTEASAFGEPSVKTYTNKIREYLIEGANPDCYEMDTPDTITFAEIEKAQQDREVHLAEVRKKDEEYKASQNAAPASTSGFAAPSTAAPASKPATFTVPSGTDFKF